MTNLASVEIVTTRAAGSTTTDDIADNAITNAKMADNAINETELVNDAVSRAKLKDEVELLISELKTN